MSTNLLLLPFVTFTAQTVSDADWCDDAILFTNNGTPIDLTGLSFAHSWCPAANPSSSTRPLTASTAAGSLVNGGPNGTLYFKVPKAAMAGVPPATYLADLTVTDGTLERNLCAAGYSTITHNAGFSP